ncbi:MAG TPA: hypothetical protein VIJ65_00860 [Acidobacteriaceae bacterium]
MQCPAGCLLLDLASDLRHDGLGLREAGQAWGYRFSGFCRDDMEAAVAPRRL